MEGRGESKQQRTGRHSDDQIGDEMLYQGRGSEARMVMAEMPEVGEKNAHYEAHGGGQGDAPRLA
jgi:hypothetical protein